MRFVIENVSAGLDYPYDGVRNYKGGNKGASGGQVFLPITCIPPETSLPLG